MLSRKRPLLWASLLLAGACRADPVTDAAHAVLKAHRAERDLKGLDVADTWQVAEELCARGEFAAAAACAASREGPDHEKLPAYVAGRDLAWRRFVAGDGLTVASSLASREASR